MKNYLILTIIFVGCLLALGCNTQGVPVENSKACDTENDGKYIEVSGFLDDKGGVFCSNTSGRMECGFQLLAIPNDPKAVKVDIEVGSGANTVEKPSSGYKRDDLKIRDNNGNVINLADKVKVTGKLRSTKDPVSNAVVCYMAVTKIEK